MRYSTKANIESEYEPRSSVLKNRLGIRSKQRMDALEFEALRKTQKHFFQATATSTQIDNRWILAIHKHFLGALYPWGGRYRTVNLSKPGFAWPPASLVSKNMATFEKEVLKNHTPCRPETLKKVAESIAIVHAELLLIHPFREGNGRVARIVADLMALQAGHPPPNFGFQRRNNRKRYLEAVKKGYLGDYSRLTEVIIEAIRRSRRKSRESSGG